MLQYSSQIVETDTLLLNFLENFLHLLFAPLFSVKCVPLLPQCWATRTLRHWDDCNTQINNGEGKKTHKCFKIFDKYCSSQSWTYHLHSWNGKNRRTTAKGGQLVKTSNHGRVCLLPQNEKKVFACKSSEVSYFPLDSWNLLSLFCYR